MSEKEKFSQLFRQAQFGFSKLFSSVLTKAGLTLPQYALLNLLSVYGTIPMTEASKHLQITKPAVTNLVDRLEESKCLKRLPHPEDRRIFLLEIQNKGRTLVNQIQGAVLDILLVAFSQFGINDQKTITQFYNALVNHLESISHKNA